MGSVWKIVALAGLLFACGCTHVTTTVPIGTTAGLGPDKALYGTWKGHFLGNREEKGAEDFFVHFLRSGDTDTEVVYVSAPSKGDENGGADRYTITTAKLGNNHYINAVQKKYDESGKESSGDNIPVLYSLTANGTLTLYLMDLDKTVAAIKAGKLAGSFSTTVGKDKDGNPETHYDYANINAQAEELDAFMAKPEAVKLFDALMVLKRVE